MSRTTGAQPSPKSPLGNRQQLINAAQDVIRDDGLTGLTVASVSKRAGLSSGFVHYYFGGKDGLHLEAMRHLTKTMRSLIAKRITSHQLPLERLLSFVRVVLGEEMFTHENCRLWLQFWAQVPFSESFARLERINVGRSRSNVSFALSKLVSSDDARLIADELIIFIDGLWLRRALGDQTISPAWATEAAINFMMDRLKNSTTRRL